VRERRVHAKSAAATPSAAPKIRAAFP